MKTLRLLITEKCTRNCNYCCNKRDEVRERFQFVNSLDDIDFTSYSSVCITGGEPLLVPDRIREVRSKLPSDMPTYLYTSLAVDELPDFNYEKFDGVNISWHDGVSYTHLGKLEDSGAKLLLRAEEGNRRARVLSVCWKLHIKYWKRNECLNNIETEDWVVWKN